MIWKKVCFFQVTLLTAAIILLPNRKSRVSKCYLWWWRQSAWFCRGLRVQLCPHCNEALFVQRLASLRSFFGAQYWVVSGQGDQQCFVNERIGFVSTRALQLKSYWIVNSQNGLTLLVQGHTIDITLKFCSTQIDQYTRDRYECYENYEITNYSITNQQNRIKVWNCRLKHWY